MIKKVFTTFFLTILLIPAVGFAAFPEPTGFVNDFASVIDGQTRSSLENLLVSFNHSTGIEVVIVTLLSLEERPVDDVAVDLYKTWGIGKKGKDNGVLFLVAPTERRMKIETGYGMEGVINDALSGRLLDEYVVPQLKSGEISQGIAAGTLALIKTITDKEGLSFDVNKALGENASALAPTQKKAKPLNIIFKIIMFIFMAYLFIRHPWLFLLFLSGGGGRGGGGFGGGFGGFGGGLSGGGGASRSW